MFPTWDFCLLTSFSCSRSQPRRQLARGRQFDHADAGDVFVGRDFGHGSSEGNRVEIEHADRAAAGRCTADRHLSEDRKSTRLNSSHANISYAVFCLKKKKTQNQDSTSSRTP